MAIGKSSKLKLGSNATPATLVDISSKLEEIKVPRELDSLETTTFTGSGSKSFEAGLNSATISTSGFWDNTIDAQLADLLANGTTVSFEYCPVNDTSGNVKYAGSCFLTKYESGAKVSESIKFSAEFQITGAVTRTVIA